MPPLPFFFYFFFYFFLFFFFFFFFCRQVVIVPDTSKAAHMAAISGAADVLIHECTGCASERQLMAIRGHSSAGNRSQFSYYELTVLFIEAWLHQHRRSCSAVAYFKGCTRPYVVKPLLVLDTTSEIDDDLSPGLAVPLSLRLKVGHTSIVK
jgi:hypothetical protein